ncbi:ion channel [Neolewinella lacunae]|uniref:Ion transporter n=1 Tax=Neolewinella lacunae TaxID=1517758 RepID=A0A923T9F4_9BACT|nr:ion channel [Neolewinella lacunae]MBC6995454.1 ion transporter [Neolewinella lacunae]MDN3635042.1 ion channel [Neolewinella lacunae]
MKRNTLLQRLGKAAPPPAEVDLGLGNKVARKPGTRLINPDGSFNVVRRGHSVFSPYQNLVEMTWPRFLALTLLAYVLINLFFGGLFLIIGTESLSNVPQSDPFWQRALSAFFFSVQTFTTVGYGGMTPTGIGANALAAFVALFGWTALAIMTGLIYARFARPKRLILFSAHALVAPYAPGGKSLQFRIANRRDSHLINVNARVVLTWLENHTRRFAPLKLERDNVALFPLNWTIVHPINEESPMYHWSKDDYCQRHSELLITIDGYDETFAQAIHINNSYLHTELVWNARFQPMYFEREATTELHLDRISHYQAEEE